MTKLCDDPSTFAEDMLAGFLDAYSSVVVGVPGGVVRAHLGGPGRVALVIGGGAGHYPAFCGLVGPGLAAGAVVGDVFAAPSAEDVCAVAKASSCGAGVLLSYGNYAGDVMNFGLAQDRLRAEGIDTRTVLVSDDVASAPPQESWKRRGIAGDFAVFKITGAAADAGYDLDGVERVAATASRQTVSLGVAFGGCTLPGRDTAHFGVPEGKMAVGMGVHGEPGIAEEALPTATQLAARLVDGLVAERPRGAGNRVAAILNGLGSTKSEELFVLWRVVSARLADAGLTVVEPEVGEFVTSLDMSGCSLSLVFLDEETEDLWRRPASSPGYSKAVRLPRGAPGVGGDVHTGPVVESDEAAQTSVSASASSRASARTVVRCLDASAAALADAEAELGCLDAVAGDGDHGRGMARGSAAALAAGESALAAGGGAGTVLVAAGDAWAARAGGTSGALWGAALRSAGESLGDGDGAAEPSRVVSAVAAGYEAMRALGGARRGDKTLLDALDPFLSTLRGAVGAGLGLRGAWMSAVDAAHQAALDTADLLPRVGRARPLAEKSRGTPDPGATSLALVLAAVGRAGEEG